VFAAFLADLALDSSVAENHGAVGVHFADEVSVVSEVGLNGSDNKGSGHGKEKESKIKKEEGVSMTE